MLSAYLLTVSGQPPKQVQEAQEMQQPSPHEGLYPTSGKRLCWIERRNTAP